MGVITYSGYMNTEKNEKQAAILMAWLNKKGYQIAGPYQVAGYNPPYTLAPFRRNEILIPLKN